MANQPSPASRALLWVIENNNDEEYLVENIDQQKRSLGALARTDWLERIFKLRQHGSSVKIELIAGLTTFVTMAYIIFVNPNVMAAAGLDHGAAFVATCLGAALGCLLMGFYANWPVGLAPGMGLNAFFTYTVVGEMGYTWQVALGAVFLSGILFMIMSLSRIREWLLNSIPMSLRFAMGAGVGLFLGLIGLKTAGIVVDSPATLVTMGSFGEPSALLAAICFLLIAVLSHRNVFGAILLSMLIVTGIGWSMGLVEYESASGVAAGGRTGLTAVTVGVLFLLATFFAPLAGMIPAYATSGALIYVAMLMMSGMAHIDWKDITDTIPAIITVVMMPLTFSIANSIALGFVTYATLKLLTGQRKKVSVSLYVLCVIFIAKFAFL